MALKGVLRTIEGNCLGFWCPGCEEMHVVSAGWTFDGNFDAPTLSPSVLVTSGHYAPTFNDPQFQPRKTECWCTFNASRPPEERAPFACSRCHSFVRGGRIEFLSDSTHHLAGQTLAMTAPPHHEEEAAPRVMP